MRLFAYIVSGILLLLVFLGGCGRGRGGPGEERAEGQGTWETTWVDPQIVATDSLYTLIRSQRVDSFLLTRPIREARQSPSIVFQVVRSGCPTAVNLFDGRQRLLRPLLVKDLSPGYYKLTLDFSRVDLIQFPRGRYFLKAESCGSVRTAYVSRD
ncbi:MAG: hypothetical protein AB1644_09955 [Candidatus Zixiibacteriota bacterium]